jgi:hypothetical protein
VYAETFNRLSGIAVYGQEARTLISRALSKLG